MSSRRKRKAVQPIPYFYDARDGRPIPIVNPNIIPPIPMPTVPGYPPDVITGGTVVTVPGGVVTPTPIQPQPWQWPLPTDQYPGYYHVPMYRDGGAGSDEETVAVSHDRDDRFLPLPPPRPFYPYPPPFYPRPRPFLYPYPPFVGPVPLPVPLPLPIPGPYYY
ncbi:hypothetical protein OS242_17540 [Tumebacillus sp. DT12]|uniref:Spore coat protein n=1 Tax=Tumebacillus lacus TaxID=2995335 RepID=A0ABT3X818_9BACL|nr:hypothetical protein [Tumebacillus lacus]MCX7571750.1 hypothetical protein [Tumebacillus lacus]